MEMCTPFITLYMVHCIAGKGVTKLPICTIFRKFDFASNFETKRRKIFAKYNAKKPVNPVNYCQFYVFPTCLLFISHLSFNNRS